MRIRLRRSLPIPHIRRPSAIFLLLAAAFVVGVVVGSLFVNVLPAAEKSDAGQQLEAALARLRGGDAVPPGEVFRRSAAFNLKTALVLWLVGLSAAGVPLVAAVLFARGFVVGFTVGFLVSQQGERGLALALASILPASLVAVPALFALGALACAFSLCRRERGTPAGRRRLWQEFARYSALSSGLAAVLILASALDGYLGPALVRLVAGT